MTLLVLIIASSIMLTLLMGQNCLNWGQRVISIIGFYRMRYNCGAGALAGWWSVSSCLLVRVAAYWGRPVVLAP